jgi:hypothetical protein
LVFLISGWGMNVRFGWCMDDGLLGVLSKREGAFISTILIWVEDLYLLLGLLAHAVRPCR